MKRALRYLFGVFLIIAGMNHFRMPEFYVSIMPAYLPWHLGLVYLSGIAEVTLGALLFVRRVTTLAAWGVVALLLAIFPANLQMALHAELYPQFTPAALWLRLPLQAVLVGLAYWFTRPDRVSASSKGEPG